MIDDNVVDDSDLAQCQWCGYVTEWDEVPRCNDANDELIQYCPECDVGEPFVGYDPAKAIIREQRIAAEAAKSDAT